ncbi:CGNR zinc finger domain-containing protein [Streptomyces sp. NPDC005820]|uniref:CGNR zinc finger domain-containing protein n=1 Tax=Streptomyces sp. NPDC005820 TaxID=3157069 RepID=UPI0033FB1C94
MTTAAHWPASARYQQVQDTAPGGLGFVQDLLNTASLGKPRKPDLLESVDTAGEWLTSSLAALGTLDPTAPPPHPLDTRGLTRLRTLRDDLRTALATSHTDEPTPTGTAPPIRVTATISVDAEGARLEPRGTGAELLRSYVLIQLAAATYADTLRRLKVCANPRCRGAFYDRSKNCSRLWHDVTTCGNTQNVRAYRARQKERGLASRH